MTIKKILVCSKSMETFNAQMNYFLDNVMQLEGPLKITHGNGGNIRYHQMFVGDINEYEYKVLIDFLTVQ